MIEKSCRCGKSKKNFKFDIGPFYIEECCIEAGYNKRGEKAKKEVTETLSIAELQIAQTLEVTDHPELDQLPDPSEVTQTLEETVLSEKDLTEESKATQKKKRQYNKSGKIKKES